MPQCTKAKITIDTIHVIDSSVNSTSEPGSHAEWYMTFNVGGETAKWSRTDVVDDTPYAVNKPITVDLDPHTEVIIKVSGYEQDDTSANDPLPTLEIKAVPAEHWQIGGTYTSGTAESDEGSYKIDYTVDCAEEGQPLTVAREYVGIYRAGSGGYALWASTWNNFVEKWKELSGQGLRLVRISTFRRDTKEWTFGEGTERVFVGIFAPGNDGYALWVAQWPSFEAKWKELSAKGLRLIDLAPYTDGGTTMYAGVFRAGNDGHALWVAQWPSFEAKWKELSAKGLRLVSLDTYVAGGKRYFTGVYRPGADGYALWVGPEWEPFKTKCKEFAEQGLRLIDIASYHEGGKQRFGGVFRAGKDSHEVLGQLTWPEFVQKWKAKSNAGQRLLTLDTFVHGREE
jgi:hypothetical protein